MSASEGTPTDTNPLRRALAAIQDLRARLATAERAARDPIAIVGVGCRLPGSAADPEAYWDMLARGESAVTEAPPDRWVADPNSHVDDDQVGGIYARHGAFIPDLKQFDARFFEISPREAKSMDPQHRLLLEVGWEALEHAAIDPTSIRGHRVGVFVGISGSDFQYVQIENGGQKGNPYGASAAATSIAAGRLSYFFGVHGPAVSFDTACSSSLVSIHAAAQSLRLNECDMALAGGVAVALSPLAVRALCQARMLSPGGRCRTFDAGADGYVRGEGCGLLVMKRLSDAIDAGDRVLGLIRGSAVNQDGRSSGLTAPNGKAQEVLLRAALANAGITAEAVEYVEAHGTGTKLGDPIELRAIDAVFGAGREGRSPLLVASVKTNIGHLEAAAGVAGVIKVLGALQRETVFPHLHFETPNPAIDWNTGNIRVPTEAVAWRRGEATRIAGVSSFGYSGTNAHLLIEEAPPEPPRSELVPDQFLLTLSARTSDALEASAGRLDAHLARYEERLDDVCYSLTVGRAVFPHRACMVVGSIAEARERLQELAEDRTKRVTTHVAASETKPRVAFLYTGQGAQYAAMGRRLFETTPVFRDAIVECDAMVEPIDGRRLLEWLHDDSPAFAGRIHRTGYAQPALFCFEYALTRLWEAWGIEPVAVVGHSVGEIAAACAADVMSLEDGLRLITARGRLMESLPAGGGMLAVRAPIEALAGDLAAHRDAVSVAAINGRNDVVLSGASAVLDGLASTFRARGVSVSTLRVSHAFHSPLMAPIVEEFRRVASSITYRPSRRRLISNLTGKPFGSLAIDADYWCRHLLEPVQFAASMETLKDLKIDVFLEIGPHPVLVGMASSDSDSQGSSWVASVRRGHDDRTSILSALGELYLRGASYDARAVALPSEPRKVALPTYLFERHQYWPDATEQRSHTASGIVRSAASGEVVFREEASIERWPWLDEHRVYGSACLPAAGYIALAMEAFEAATGDRAVMASLAIGQPLVVEPDQHRPLQVVLTPDGNASFDCAVFASSDETEASWQKLASCHLEPRRAADNRPDDLAAARSRCSGTLDVASIYAEIETAGVSYGPAFRPIETLASGVGEVIATMRVPFVDGRVLRPALFDAAIFQVVGAAWIAASADARGGDAFLPIGVERLDVGSIESVRTITCHARLHDLPRAGDTVIMADLKAWDEAGTLVLEATGVSARRAPREAIARALSGSLELLYELAWKAADPVVPGSLAGSRWLVLGAASGVGGALAEAVAAGGGFATCAPVIGEGPDPAERVRAIVDAAIAEGSLSGLLLPWSAVEGGDLVSRTHALAEMGLASIQAVASAMDAGGQPVRVVVATSGAAGTPLGGAEGIAGAPLWGLVRVARNERPDLDLQIVDVATDESVPASAAQILPHLSAVTTPDWQSSYRRGARHVPRLVRTSRDSRPDRLDVPETPYQLTIAIPGVFDGLVLSPLEIAPPGPRHVQIEVSASGLNFRDVLNALGAYPGGGPLGSEVAGRVVAVGPEVTRVAVGDRVMAITSRGFCSQVCTEETFVRRIPKECSDEDAATIPAAFLTVEYALRTVGRLRAGERILIHAAAGGVGMAAVRLSRELGAHVFATAGSESKRRLLREMGIEHVMDSRSLDFADEVRRVTGGEGVDVVLNSLTGEAIDRGFSVLRNGGRFLEIGKAEWRNPDDVHAAWPGIRYITVDLTQVIRDEPQQIGVMLDSIGDAMEAGRLAPLPRRLFALQQVREAFRFMAQAKHVGKVVVCHGPPPGRCRPHATYLVTGGAGAIGLQMARWLADRGASDIVLVGRRAPSAEADQFMADLVEGGVNIRFERADVTSREQVDTLVRSIPETRPLRGVIHAAGALDDGVLAEMTSSRLASVMAPKVDGAWNLHEATRRDALDFFVLFSSSAGVFGSPGQANYAAGNTFLDALAHHRHAAGLSALSVDWGPWGNSGMAARLEERDRARIESTGVRPLEHGRAVKALDEALLTGQPQEVVIDIDWPTLSRALSKTAVPLWLKELVRAPSPPEHGDKSSRPRRDARADDLATVPAEQRAQWLRAHIGEQLKAVLALDAETIAPDDTFVTLGMDSLTAVELRNRLQQGLGLRLAATAVLEHPSVAELAAFILEAMPREGTDAENVPGRETLEL